MDNKIKKLLKTIIIFLIILITLFTIYITIEKIRLQNSTLGTKPLITINETISETRVKYTGIGFTIEYYLNPLTDGQTNNTPSYEEKYYGVTFKLFDKFIIWGWVT